jgi:hypothetical protein
MTELEDFGVALVEPHQAHGALQAQVWPMVKTQTGLGNRLWLTVQPLEDARSIRQNKFYWVVLKQISQQAQHEGVGADSDGWHLYYKRMFLGYEFKKTRLPGKKRPSVTRELRSTTKLSVKAFAEYIEQVQAHAATTFGVEFTELLPAELKPERKAKTKTATVIDNETGEIQEMA